jgi:hypothetical protein
VIGVDLVQAECPAGFPKKTRAAGAILLDFRPHLRDNFRQCEQGGCPIETEGKHSGRNSKGEYGRD